MNFVLKILWKSEKNIKNWYQKFQIVLCKHYVVKFVFFETDIVCSWQHCGDPSFHMSLLFCRWLWNSCYGFFKMVKKKSNLRKRIVLWRPYLINFVFFETDIDCSWQYCKDLSIQLHILLWRWLWTLCYESFEMVKKTSLITNTRCKAILT